MKIIDNKLLPILTLLVVSVLVTSCSTTRKITTMEVKPMSASKLVRKTAREMPSYNTYESNRVVFEYQTDDEKSNFSGQLKMKRNECLIVSLKKFSLPVGKGMISPDSIAFINFFDKSYVTGNFNDVHKLLGVDIDYNLVQSILTADLSHIFDEKDFDKNLSATIDSQMYRLNRHTKIHSAKKSTINDNFYLSQTENMGFNDLSFWIDPKEFTVKKVTLHNDQENKNIIIRYNEWEKIGRNQFPQEVIFDYFSPSQKATFIIRLAKSSVNNNSDFNFTIPEKYEKMKLKGL